LLACPLAEIGVLDLIALPYQRQQASASVRWPQGSALEPTG